MPSIGISEYWTKWLQDIVDSGIRKSKAEVVEEGLKAIKRQLDLDADELRLAKEKVKEDRELDDECPVNEF